MIHVKTVHHTEVVKASSYWHGPSHRVECTINGRTMYEGESATFDRCIRVRCQATRNPILIEKEGCWSSEKQRCVSVGATVQEKCKSKVCRKTGSSYGGGYRYGLE